MKVTEIKFCRGLILHRENGPTIIYMYGSEEWFKNGRRHREDGPASTYINVSKGWWLNGVRHRIGGPAVILSDGSMGWWENGEFIKREDKNN